MNGRKIWMTQEVGCITKRLFIMSFHISPRRNAGLPEQCWTGQIVWTPSKGGWAGWTILRFAAELQLGSSATTSGGRLGWIRNRFRKLAGTQFTSIRKVMDEIDKSQEMLVMWLDLQRTLASFARSKGIKYIDLVSWQCGGREVCNVWEKITRTNNLAVLERWSESESNHPNQTWHEEAFEQCRRRIQKQWGSSFHDWDDEYRIDLENLKGHNLRQWIHCFKTYLR